MQLINLHESILRIEGHIMLVCLQGTSDLLWLLSQFHILSVEIFNRIVLSTTLVHALPCMCMSLRDVVIFWLSDVPVHLALPRVYVSSFTPGVNLLYTPLVRNRRMTARLTEVKIIYSSLIFRNLAKEFQNLQGAFSKKTDTYAFFQF